MLQSSGILAKGHIEKNHVLIHQTLSKSAKFNILEGANIHSIPCHINSVVRELFDNQTTFDLMRQKREYNKLLDILTFQPIPLDEAF